MMERLNQIKSTGFHTIKIVIFYHSFNIIIDVKYFEFIVNHIIIIIIIIYWIDRHMTQLTIPPIY